MTGVTGAIDATCDKETDTFDSGLAVVVKLAELLEKFGNVVTCGEIPPSAATGDTFGTSETASNLVTVAVGCGGVDFTTVVDVSVASAEDWLGTLVTITELEVVSAEEDAETAVGAITGAITA